MSRFLARVAILAIVVLLALQVAGSFVHTKLGGPCPGGQGVFPGDCPTKYMEQP